MAKKVCLYGILSAVCIVTGYIEHFITLDFIAPGIKPGIANAIALLLIASGDIKGAFAVNIVRILLCGLLFATPYSLIFSLSGGIASLTVMSILSKSDRFGLVGFSIAGAAVHNTAQLICARITLGAGVWYYSGILLIAALFSGLATGTAAELIYKKLDKIIKN